MLHNTERINREGRKQRKFKRATNRVGGRLTRKQLAELRSLEELISEEEIIAAIAAGTRLKGVKIA